MTKEIDTFSRIRRQGAQQEAMNEQKEWGLLWNLLGIRHQATAPQPGEHSQGSPAERITLWLFNA